MAILEVCADGIGAIGCDTLDAESCQSPSQC